MKFGFYEWLIISQFIVLVVIFAASVILKLIYNRQYDWEIKEKERIVTEIQQLMSGSKESGFPDNITRLAAVYRQNIRQRRDYDLLEKILFEMIEHDKEMAATARAIADGLDLPKHSVLNLKKHNPSIVLRGCLQAKAYLYQPAIPYLLAHLQHPGRYLQYDILRALSRFDDPEVIIQAFSVIQDAILVNERAVHEVIDHMTPKNRVILFRRILDLKSAPLTTLFLKCIDKDSAIVLKESILPLFYTSTIKELRIAVVRAMGTAQDPIFITPLLTALMDSAWEIRAVAAKGLESAADEQLLPNLLKAVCDDNWWVRHNAALALLASPKPESILMAALRLAHPDAVSSLRYAAELTNKRTLLREFEDNLKFYNQIIADFADSKTVELHNHSPKHQDFPLAI